MPVTVKIAKHDANPVKTGQGGLVATGKFSQDVLRTLAHKDAGTIGPILHTGLGPQTSLSDAKLQDTHLKVQDHGLIRAAYYAYSHHYHLVLRPEDVWFAVLTQFSFYVNAHAEELRSSFVAHSGKKGLVVRDPGQPDMGLMCRNMTKLIDANIVDAELRKWILPSFSTTTLDDEVVAAVIMMGTLQKYFEYVFDCTACGIPTVTLLGERSDWEDIQRRIEKLAEYGEEPTRFCGLLRPILKYMVASYTSPPGNPTIVDFWSRIIHRTNGSGSDTLSGWMVAFSFWDEDGKCLATPKPWYNKMVDGVTFHEVEFHEVAAGFVSVPVKYISPDEIVTDTKLLAGFAGFEASSAIFHPWEEQETKQKVPSRFASSRDKIMSKLRRRSAKTSDPTDEQGQDTPLPVSDNSTLLDTEPLLTAIRPVTAWWMYEVQGGENTGKRGSILLREKIASDWNSQASTGDVQPDGSIVVRDGI